MLTKIIRTYPSTSSLLVLFKSKRLKVSQSFTEFLIKKIYPMGFLKWSVCKEDDKPDPERLSEIWNKNKGKDLNKSNSNDKDVQFYLVFEKNQSWERVMEENIRTLVFYNIFMTPQEKKIKLKLKEQILSNLFDSKKSSPNAFNLLNVSTMATSLLVLKALLTEADSGVTLFYNQENIAHSIKYLKSSQAIFKVLSEFMRVLNPISPEAEILSPLLLQLLSHLTSSSDPKIEKDEAEEEKHLELQEEKEEEEEVDSSQEMVIDEQPEGDLEGQEDEEGEEDEGEGEDDEEEIDPFIEEIATQSEELSLDDMIENLEYDEQEGDESESDDDEGGDGSEDDEGMEMDEIDSDEAEEMLNQMEDADVIGIIEEQDDPMDDMESQQEGNDEDVIEDDQQDEVYNVIDVDPQIPHFNMRRRQLINLENDEDFEFESNNFGFQQLLDMLHYRAPARANNPFRNDYRDPLDRMGLSGIRGQIRRVDQRSAQRRAGGLDTLYQLDYTGRRENDNEFWNSNINVEETANNRNRSQRNQDDILRDPFSNLIARDIQQIRNDLQNIRGDIDDIRERINERGLFGARGGRAGEREEVKKTNTNPFEIIKKLKASQSLADEISIEDA